MAENNNNSALEPIQKGAQAANAIKGAVKTGKAIAAAAKGASAGGPYGAIIGFAWGSRKAIVKILIAVIAFMMIPVMIICMLPSLIFGGLSGSHSADNPDVPILNDSTVVNDNLTEITSKISPILNEALEDIIISIDADFPNTGAEFKETITPYENSIEDNVNSFISQYCASKNEDHNSVSVSDMENIIRQNKDKLYSYTLTIEERPVRFIYMTVNSETGEVMTSESIVNKKYAVYKIVYNGADYFANEIFGLTDEQKALAEDYSENLSLFLNAA